MRACYKKYYEITLISEMKKFFPEFNHLDKKTQKKIGKPVFYGPGNLLGFYSNPVDNLIFVITFRAPPRADDFEASFEWSEMGLIEQEEGKYSEINVSAVFSNETFELTTARSLMQTLSMKKADAGYHSVINWHFWKPKATIDDPEAWYKEFYEDELRNMPDEEAKQRVEQAILTAMRDIKLYAMPWFDAKLAQYQSAQGKSCAC